MTHIVKPFSYKKELKIVLRKYLALSTWYLVRNTGCIHPFAITIAIECSITPRTFRATGCLVISTTYLSWIINDNENQYEKLSCFQYCEEIWYYVYTPFLPFLTQTSAFGTPRQPEARSGWYSTKLFIPQDNPEGHVTGSQSPSPWPHTRWWQ